MDNEHMGETVERGCAALGMGSYGSKLVTPKTTQLGGVRRGRTYLIDILISIHHFLWWNRKTVCLFTL